MEVKVTPGVLRVLVFRSRVGWMDRDREGGGKRLKPDLVERRVELLLFLKFPWFLGKMLSMVALPLARSPSCKPETKHHSCDV